MTRTKSFTEMVSAPAPVVTMIGAAAVPFDAIVAKFEMAVTLIVVLAVEVEVIDVRAVSDALAVNEVRSLPAIVSVFSADTAASLMVRVSTG